MEKKKLISARLDKEVIDAVDSFAEKHDYLSRSSIINALLYVNLFCTDEDTFWQLLSVRHPYEKGYAVRFEKEAGMAAKRAAQANPAD